MSNAEFPKKIPVKPPEMNSDTKPNANIIATVNLKLPFQIVVNQLNTFTADGTAINNVSNTKIEPKKGLIPVTNI